VVVTNTGGVNDDESSGEESLDGKRSISKSKWLDLFILSHLIPSHPCSFCTSFFSALCDFSSIRYTINFFSTFIMVYFSKLASVVAVVCLAVAHPGEHHDHAVIKRSIQARDQMASAAKRSIDSCSSSLKHRELNARSIARRAETARALRQARGINSSE
jgi:hypothetical protein